MLIDILKKTNSKIFVLTSLIIIAGCMQQNNDEITDKGSELEAEQNLTSKYEFREAFAFLTDEQFSSIQKFGYVAGEFRFCGYDISETNEVLEFIFSKFPLSAEKNVQIFQLYAASAAGAEAEAVKIYKSPNLDKKIFCEQKIETILVQYKLLPNSPDISNGIDLASFYLIKSLVQSNN